MERADALIVTAVKEEWDAVLAVDTGAMPGSASETSPGAAGLEVAFRDFTTAHGVLRVAVTQALGMGGVAAVNAAAPPIDPLDVQCPAMCGVCAGRRGEIELGDVIIADRLWTYDAGKRKVAESQPEAFLPSLAASLSNLGTAQDALEQREAALFSTREAAHIYRKLTESRPDAFLPYLAHSLNNLSMAQSMLGQREAARASSQEALDAIWDSFLRLPTAFTLLTSTILGNLRIYIKALGRSPTPDLLARIALFESKRSSTPAPGSS